MKSPLILIIALFLSAGAALPARADNNKPVIGKPEITTPLPRVRALASTADAAAKTTSARLA